MRLSKRRQYGLKATVYLASRAESGYCQAREIARAEALPAKFLESVLLALRGGDILVSKVGAGGGYRLARDPGEILVGEILDACVVSADGPGDEVDAGSGGVGEAGVAFLHDRLEDAIEASIGRLTIADLLDELEAVPAGAPGRG